MGNYVPNTSTEQQEMLKEIGVSSFDELYSNVPANLKIGKLNIPEGKSELATRCYMENIANKNHVFSSIFRGAGAYNHYIPSSVKEIAGKEEFMTSYTPYQAEISQGTLQSIFEFQTMICEITGMEAANASVYDGASAAAEAITMVRERKRNKMLVAATSNPKTIDVMRTYSFGSGVEIEIVPAKDGKTDLDALKSQLMDETVAGFYVEQVNFKGIIEDAEEIGEIVHETKAKFVLGFDPVASIMLKTPKECGADVAVGEGQGLGIALSYGGPYLGLMAASEKLIRRLPGRIIGETTDLDGERSFVMTLRAREQDIRREKSSSNICSNQALCALTAGVYMSLMGKIGMHDVANQSYSKAHYLADQLATIPGFSLVYDKPFFNEFVMSCPKDTDEVMKQLEAHDILGGLPVEEGILWCTTEMNSKESIDELVTILREVCK